MLQLTRMIAGLLADAFRLLFLLLQTSVAIRAQNLVLRRQLAGYVVRAVKPRRVDFVTRVCLALLTRLFDWRDAMVLVRPETIIRWHRLG